MDEGESNSEPAESMILLSKDAEEKDPLSIALPETPSSDTQTKEDHDRENDQRSPSDVATPEDEADIPAQSSKTAGDDEKKVEVKGEKENKDVKDSEMLSKLANIKQESNSSTTEDFQSKESSSSSSVLIKKEPSEEEANQNNQQQTQPADLKVKIEIKSEKNVSNSVPSDISNQMPNEQDNNNNAENLVCKPIEKLSAAVPSSSDNSSSSSQPLSSKETENTTGTDYSMKTFMEHQQRDGIKVEQNAKTEQNKSPDVKPLHPFSIVDREDGKMPPNDQQQQAPPGMLRHPYEPLMMKYDLPSHPAMDLKYLPPEHPARAFAENVALKSHFSADNLIKGSYPSDHNKYPPESGQAPPSSQPMDVSRVTPNQDSQGSNSNSQPATLPSPSPLTSSAPSTVSSSHPSVQPPPSSLFVSHPGLMSAHHPSLLGGPPLSAASLVSTASPFLPIPSGLPRPDPIPSSASRGPFSSSGLTTSSITSSISSVGSAFGPGGSSLYSRASESNGRDSTLR